MTQHHQLRSAWTSIRLAHGAWCLCHRSWTFFLPLYLSHECPGSGLRPTAAFRIVQSLSVAVLSTTVANVYRKQQQQQFAFASCVGLEKAAVLVQGLLLSHFSRGGGGKGGSYCEAPFHSSSFCLVLLCGVIDALFSSLLSMIISKEWVAVLFKTGKEGTMPYDLSKANAVLSQIDLVLAALSPLLVSYGLQHRNGGYDVSLKILVGMQAVGAIVISLQARRALNFCAELSMFPEYSSTGKVSNGTSCGKDRKSSAPQNSKGSLFSTVDLCSSVSLPVRLTSASFIILFFTVLSPNLVLSAWLNTLPDSVRISEGWIAAFGSASQFCGVLATLIAPAVIRRCQTVEKAAAVSQWFQAFFILLAATCFYRLDHLSSLLQSNFSSQDGAEAKLCLGAFLVFICISRIGFWIFDLAERQMLQLSVPRQQQTLLFNAERGATQLTSLGMVYLCYRFPSQSEFHLLVGLSTGAVCTASLLLLWQLVISHKAHHVVSIKKKLR